MLLILFLEKNIQLSRDFFDEVTNITEISEKDNKLIVLTDEIRKQEFEHIHRHIFRFIEDIQKKALAIMFNSDTMISLQQLLKELGKPPEERKEKRKRIYTKRI